MSTYDVRTDKNEIKEIIFSNGKNVTHEFYTADTLNQSHSWTNAVDINDPDGTTLIVEGKQGGEDLIKAIEKAISLGWLK